MRREKVKAEPAHTQRHLTGLRLHMSDAEVLTKYVLPFVDASWSVAFTVVDAMTYGPRIFRGSLELRSGALYTDEPTAKLERITSLPVSGFDELVHFDPWWVFRGVGGVDRAWIDAVLATNIAGTFNHEGSVYKLHDLEFDPALKTLVGIVAKDPVFRTVTFRRGDLALLGLRKPLRK
jgi:hypothetical protein